jgi:hypothetical protein
MVCCCEVIGGELADPDAAAFFERRNMWCLSNAFIGGLCALFMRPGR